MKYLAAYLLLQKGGNESPSAKELTTLLETVGADVDAAKIKLLLAAVEGKSTEELIAEGASKLTALPAAGAASSGAAAAGGDDAAEEAAESEEEEEEESDSDMGMGLFD